MSAVPAVDWTSLERERLARLLRKNLEGEVRFDAAARVLYSTDASIYEIEPLGVVFPKSRADLAAAVAIAVEQRVPIVPRGGGTSLSGQAVGPGVVFDCSKHLCRVLETNIAEGWVRVEPGVVLSQLQKHLAPMGFQFGPDVATADRATLGGMIGNNSAGSRSLLYGKTIDHVRELEVVLSGGRPATFAELRHEELLAKMGLPGLEGRIHRTVFETVQASAEEIRRRFPKILRRVSGYNLDAFLPPQPFHLAKLFVGAEGTLGVVTEARLGIVPSPKHRGLAVLHYATLGEALASLGPLLETEPSAIELIDRMILDLARRSMVYRDRLDFVEGRPEAVFLVEYFADEPDEVAEKLAALAAPGSGFAAGPVLVFDDAKSCEAVWSVRKTALPLLFSLPGSRKPVTFVEDTAVAPEKLPEFVRRFQEILVRHGTFGSVYGHASVGCLHIRPLLDLRRKDEVREMRRIADEVVQLVLEFGGALSGEHGDGLSRSQFNREMFGPEVYQAFRTIKNAFDPDNLFNPGKIVDAPPMDASLRLPLASSGREVWTPEAGEQPATLLSFAADGGAIEVARRCNGNALCRREGVGTMCPSFMATRDEQHSPRGRANLLRAAMDGRLAPDRSGSWASRDLDQALDLCLACKACKTECPSNVDVAKLKSEYLYQRSRHRARPLVDRFLADFRAQAELGSRLAPFSNWILRAWPTRWLMDRLVGVDRRRLLPRFHRRTLERWFRGHVSEARRNHGKVVLLADCFTNFHQPQVGRDAVWLLERAGYQVYLANVCCGRPLFTKGLLAEARELVRTNVARLAPFAEDGIVILGVEPSCLFALVDEWRDILPGEATELVARQSRLVETWLDQRTQWGGTDLPPPRTEPMEVLVHGHCHQKAAGALDGSVEALRRLAAIDPLVLDAGCCGMAGFFGYEKQHYDVSRTIAEQRLLPALRRAPAACVVAPGFSCRSQIADLTRRKTIHPVQLIRRRIEETSAAEPPVR